MTNTVTVRKTGSALSVTIPKEMAERMHLERGDRLFAVETSEGVLLTPYDPTVEQAMIAYRRIARKRRAALRELSR